MKNKLKEVAEENNWKYFYARRDFLNLEVDEGDSSKVHLMVDPIVIQEQFDEYGNSVSRTYSGHMMLLLSSTFNDSSYEDKYDENILPLLTQASNKIKESFSCTEFTVGSWQTVEIINAFDFNFDGIIINYMING